MEWKRTAATVLLAGESQIDLMFELWKEYRNSAVPRGMDSRFVLVPRFDNVSSMLVIDGKTKTPLQKEAASQLGANYLVRWPDGLTILNRARMAHFVSLRQRPFVWLFHGVAIP